MQKFAATTEIIDIDTTTACLTHVWLVFEKGYDIMKHVKYYLYWKTRKLIRIETNFYKHNQEHFLFLFRMDNFAAMQGVVLLSETGVVGGDASFSSSLSSRNGFSAEPPISKSLNSFG